VSSFSREKSDTKQETGVRECIFVEDIVFFKKPALVGIHFPTCSFSRSL
jgi:hypothetical protein